MRATEWIALAGIGVALLSNLITLIVTWMTLRHNARQEERRLAEDRRNRHIDRTRETYASFAKNGWNLTIARYITLKEGGGKEPSDAAEVESSVKDRLDTDYAMLQLLAPSPIRASADEYYEAVIAFGSKHIYGRVPHADIDKDRQAVEDLHGCFVSVVRRSFKVATDEPRTEGEATQTD